MISELYEERDFIKKQTYKQANAQTYFREKAAAKEKAIWKAGAWDVKSIANLFHFKSRAKFFFMDRAEVSPHVQNN